MLDVSSSFLRNLGTAVALIRALAGELEVDEVRLVQVGRGVRSDERLSVWSLEEVAIHGTVDDELFVFTEYCDNCRCRHTVRSERCPPTDLRPAFRHLDDGRCESVVVCTDGPRRRAGASTGVPCDLGDLRQPGGLRAGLGSATSHRDPGVISAVQLCNATPRGAEVRVKGQPSLTQPEEEE
jgi:hypothetical protein